jgi:hypothetical protein
VLKNEDYEATDSMVQPDFLTLRLVALLCTAGLFEFLLTARQQPRHTTQHCETRHVSVTIRALSGEPLEVGRVTTEKEFVDLDVTDQG